MDGAAVQLVQNVHRVVVIGDPAHHGHVEGLVAQMAAAVRNARLQKERRRLEAAEAAARAVATERERAAQVLQAVGETP